MQDFLAISKALADENRVRAILALVPGELCLCQLIVLLRLAPSTVSKHMNILFEAGLVNRRKEGKWHYFSLAGDDVPQPVRQGLAWVRESLRDDPGIHDDGRRRKGVLKKSIEELCACYRS